MPASLRPVPEHDLANTAYLAKWPARPITLPWRDHEKGKPVIVQLMVTTRERTVINRSYFNARIWTPALREAGVPVRGPTAPMLRGTSPGARCSSGESIRAVSEYLGHAEAGFTLRTYTHLMRASAERSRNAIDAAFAIPDEAATDLTEIQQAGD